MAEKVYFRRATAAAEAEGRVCAAGIIRCVRRGLGFRSVKLEFYVMGKLIMALRLEKNIWPRLKVKKQNGAGQRVRRVEGLVDQKVLLGSNNGLGLVNPKFGQV